VPISHSCRPHPDPTGADAGTDDLTWISTTNDPSPPSSLGSSRLTPSPALMTSPESSSMMSHHHCPFLGSSWLHQPLAWISAALVRIHAHPWVLDSEETCSGCKLEAHSWRPALLPVPTTTSINTVASRLSSLENVSHWMSTHFFISSLISTLFALPFGFSIGGATVAIHGIFWVCITVWR
jgi:hypothetical protein